MKRQINKGSFWSKKFLVNFEEFNSNVSTFYKKYHVSSCALDQISSMFLKNGKKSKIKKILLKTLIGLNEKKIKAKQLERKKKFVIRQKKKLKFVGTFLLKYRIFGRMKNRYIRRRTVNYPTYITFYNQWRRTIRFLGVFFKKRGIFEEKFKTEISKINAKDFRVKRTSIIHRTNNLFTGLYLKYMADYGSKGRPGFYMRETNFSKKYIKIFFEKYSESSKRDLKFLRRSHPKSRKK